MFGADFTAKHPWGFYGSPLHPRAVGEARVGLATLARETRGTKRGSLFIPEPKNVHDERPNLGTIGIMQDELRTRIEANAAKVEALRHELHSCPELGFKELQTSAIVRRELDALGIRYVGGLGGGTGVLAYLPATVDGKPKTVALRADMDALPIREENELPYASKIHGMMHACGHDGHTATLLGAAGALSQTATRVNDVLLIFQPSEESRGGAKHMIEDGVLSGSVLGNPPDVIYGMHGIPDEEVGQVFTRVGPLMAATDEFQVTIVGKGGHAGHPNLGVDPIAVFAQVVSAVQTIASRNVPPTEGIVISVGHVHAGEASNVIPDELFFRGTMRTLTAEVRELGKRRFYESVEGVAKAMGAEARIEWRVGYPVTSNDGWATERLWSVVRRAFGEERLCEEPNPSMGGEDFSFYGAHVPACFFYMGLRPAGVEEYPGLHTPKFDFNDEALPDAVELMCRLALEPVVGR